MSSEPTKILGPDGKPAKRPKSDRCPGCGAGPDKREETQCFGSGKVTNCTNCGHRLEGASE